MHNSKPYTMSPLSTISQPVSKEMLAFEPYFRESIRSKVPLLSIITNYLYRRKGKQLRPLLVFLSAGATGGITQSTYVGAAMIELLHTATLMHDDVVDEAYERRGGFSINALWRSKIAVLAGDFLLSKGLLMGLETGEHQLLRNMSHAVKEMSQGELQQIELTRRMNTDEATYFEIIRMKTATLLASCCVNGACSSGAPSGVVATMEAFGLNIGMAFQLRDDMLDYLPKGLLGKPTGNDVRERKLTLPLIHALSLCSPVDNKRIRALVRRSKRSSKALRQVIEFATEHGGVYYTQSVMEGYKQKALDNLAQLGTTNQYTDALAELANYITLREK